MLNTFDVFDPQELLSASPKLVTGRAVSSLKNLPRQSRDQHVAGFVAAGTSVLLTQAQWAMLAGTSATGITKALNGHRRKHMTSPALTGLEALLQEVAQTASNIRWRSPEVERAELEDLDRSFGQYIAAHESALEAWRDRSGTTASSLLGQAVRTFDQLLTTILSNDNLA